MKPTGTCSARGGSFRVQGLTVFGFRRRSGVLGCDSDWQACGLLQVGACIHAQLQLSMNLQGTFQEFSDTRCTQHSTGSYVDYAVKAKYATLGCQKTAESKYA